LRFTSTWTYDQAVAAYKESLKLNPGQFEALANLGDARFRLGRAEDALNVLIQAEAIKSNDSKLHHLLGEVYIQLGNRDDASREYEILKQLGRSLADDLGKLMSPNYYKTRGTNEDER
jgi:Flp pilus assembly protein TadD